MGTAVLGLRLFRKLILILRFEEIWRRCGDLKKLSETSVLGNRIHVPVGIIGMPQDEHRLEEGHVECPCGTYPYFGEKFDC